LPRFVRPHAAAKIAPELEEILAGAGADEQIDVIAETREQADLASLPPNTSYDEKIAYLQFTAETAQREILAWLEATEARNVRTTWLVSSIALTATPTVIRTLAAREDVAFVTDDFIITLDAQSTPALSTAPAAESDLLNEWGIIKVRAPECWAAGFNGAGVVVGNIDTGVEVGHPAFGGRWRSNNGWFDGVNGQLSPYDDYGHGTHCMGSAVGGSGIGVAPGATFIAAKGLDATGGGQVSQLEACLDWMAGTGRPDVLSNSWTSGRTDTQFFNRFVNLRNLGMVVVGAIGNAGPNSGTSLPPGSFPILIGVGATNSSDAVASFSSRGPAPNQSPWNNQTYWPWSGWNLLNPGISAPGVDIRSAWPGGTYHTIQGTSMACPHVAGAAAILLHKKSNLTHTEIFTSLAAYARRPSGGAPYPNHNYGCGILDCKATLDNIGGSVDDTLRVHNSYGDNGIGLTNGGTFYTAARLTPTRGSCEVVAGIFLQHEASQNQRYFFWGSSGPPIDSVPYGGSGTGWKRVNLATPFWVAANQDFWLGPRFQHSAGQYPGGVDVGPAVPERGGWINYDGSWTELRLLGLNFNWMIAAIVRYAGSVEEELLEPVPNQPQVHAATFARDGSRISYTLPTSGPVELNVYSISGGLVRRLVKGNGQAGEHTVAWNLTDDAGRRVANGVYCCRLAVGGRVFSTRVVALK
jgi:subtilisin family serine protease